MNPAADGMPQIPLDQGIGLIGLGVAKGSKKTTTVIGHLPEYINVAKKVGAKYLKPLKNWNWKIQGAFIKKVIKRGDDVLIGTRIRGGPSVLKREIKQLIKAGYKLVRKNNQLWLTK